MHLSEAQSAPATRLSRAWLICLSLAWALANPLAAAPLEQRLGQTRDDWMAFRLEKASDEAVVGVAEAHDPDQRLQALSLQGLIALEDFDWDVVSDNLREGQKLLAQAHDPQASVAFLTFRGAVNRRRGWDDRALKDLSAARELGLHLPGLWLAVTRLTAIMGSGFGSELPNLSDRQVSPSGHLFETEASGQQPLSHFCFALDFGPYPALNFAPLYSPSICPPGERKQVGWPGRVQTFPEPASFFSLPRSHRLWNAA